MTARTAVCYRQEHLASTAKSGAVALNPGSPSPSSAPVDERASSRGIAHDQVRDRVDEVAADLVEPSRSRGARLLRLAGILAVVAVVVTLVAQSGVWGHVTDEDRLRETVDNAGAWGPLLFLGLMILLVPLNVPGIVFVIPATTIFGTAAGIGLSYTGGFVASVIGIVAARRLGRKAFEDKLPPRIRRFETRLSERGFWAVVVLRIFTFLAQPVDWLVGLSSMPMRTALTATAVGLVIPTIVISLTGGGLFQLVL